MATAAPPATEDSFWFVGAIWGGTDDRTERFVEEGVWVNGYEDRFLDEVRAMRPGERIAIKSSFTRKHDCPFENHGHVVSVMRIKAIGTIVENPGNGLTVKVDWQRIEPRDWYFYTNRTTLWRVHRTGPEAEQLIAFAFEGRDQDFDWWTLQPSLRERFGPRAEEFGWTDFYQTLADALPAWRARRSELVAIVREALAQVDGISPLIDRHADGSAAPLADIDPFTLFGVFNRRILDEKRVAIAGHIADRLGLGEAPPSSFDGIPVLNNLKSWFFSYARTRDPSAIERLWDVFEAALALNGGGDKAARSAFAEAFDAARKHKNVRFNLGIGLFWICPWRLPSLDAHTRRAIEKELWLPGPLNAPPSGADYLGIADRLFERFEQDSPFQSIPQLVRDAWSGKSVAAEEDEEAEEPDGAEDDQANTQFVPDDAEVEHDELGRGVLAIALARRLHKIWCAANRRGGDAPAGSWWQRTMRWLKARRAGGPNRAASPPPEDAAAFVVHIDAPWGGGKTSFAHFLTKVLNPYGGRARRPARFIADRYGEGFNAGSLFLDPKSAVDLRRPWITVWFNAWQAEHCAPPWWVFYQTIRKRSFAAIRTEGDEPLDPAGAPPRTFQPPAIRLFRWAALWAREYGWRLMNPKIRTLLATALISLSLIWVLQRLGVIGAGEEGSVEFIIGNGLGLGLAALTGIGALWGFGSLITESIVPGTSTVAERLSLGGGDPYQRFRRHFYNMMKAVRRPVMVIIDDLDRCRPEFVVDLVRGIQTLLRSPRVVFVILGDRDWIERAFETHHQAMSKLNVGPEQTFGARFVEKAIQMSFILPEMPADRQESYVRGILLRTGADSSGPADEAAEVASEVRDLVQRTGAEATNAAEFKAVRDQAFAAYQDKARPGDGKAMERAQIDKLVNEELAIHAAVSDTVQDEIKHRLECLATCLPANPRQIKRIINSITMYYAVALQQNGMAADDPRCLELAIWVVIMTEWPDSWRVLACCPELVEILAADDPEAALAALDVALLPGSPASTLREIRRMRADPRLMKLIEGKADDLPRLTTASVKAFQKLTPLYSRRQRLAETDAGAAAP